MHTKTIPKEASKSANRCIVETEDPFSLDFQIYSYLESFLTKYHQLGSSLINFQQLQSFSSNFYQLESSSSNFHQLQSFLSKSNQLGSFSSNFHQLQRC